jgi:hypothetical protein
MRGSMVRAHQVSIFVEKCDLSKIQWILRMDSKSLMFCCWSFFTLLTSICLLCSECSGLADLTCPDEFHIQQDSSLRMYRVVEDTKCLCTILNSDYGVFDFYDPAEKRQWTNRFDSLYDDANNCIGLVKLASDTEGFWERKSWFQQSTAMEIFSGEKQLLLCVEAEGDGQCFVFRDAENNRPLAVALWSWIPTWSWFSVLGYHVQDWQVMIIDRERMQEKNIPNIFLVWALLKHSQKHHPSPDLVPYQQTLPDLPR